MIYTMKIFVVTSGRFDDVAVEGAYSTRELADAAAQLCNDGEVTEVELDQVPAHEPGKRLFRVWMSRDGTFPLPPEQVSAFGQKEEVVAWSEKARKGWTLILWTKDADAAVRLAGEKRLALLPQPAPQA